MEHHGASSATILEAYLTVCPEHREDIESLQAQGETPEAIIRKVAEYEARYGAEATQAPQAPEGDA